MNADIKTSLEKLVQLGERNASEITKLVTLLDTMMDRTADSFGSAASDFAAMAESIAELKYDVTEFCVHTHEEFDEIRATLTEITRKVQVGAGGEEIAQILGRVSAIEAHLGIEQVIAA